MCKSIDNRLLLSLIGTWNCSENESINSLANWNINWKCKCWNRVIVHQNQQNYIMHWIIGCKSPKYLWMRDRKINFSNYASVHPSVGSKMSKSIIYCCCFGLSLCSAPTSSPIWPNQIVENWTTWIIATHPKTNGFHRQR